MSDIASEQIDPDHGGGAHGHESTGMFVIPEGLDFVNQFLIFSLIVCAVLEIIYLMSPQIAKTRFNLMDFNKDAGHKISYTGLMSIFLLVLFFLSFF